MNKYWERFSTTNSMILRSWTHGVTLNISILKARELTRDNIVRLTSGMTPVESGITLNEANNWTYTNTDLPSADINDNEYHYFAVERAKAGYADTYLVNGNRTIIQNRAEETPTTGFSFSKVWYGEDGTTKTAWPQVSGADLPITVTLKRKMNEVEDTSFAIQCSLTSASASIRSKTPSDAGGTLSLGMSQGSRIYSYEFRDLDASGSLGQTTGEWTYYAEEASISGYATSYTDASNAAAPHLTDSGTVKNTKSAMDFVFHKVWLPMDTSSTVPQDWVKPITVRLYDNQDVLTGKYVISYADSEFSITKDSSMPSAPDIQGTAADKDFMFTLSGLDTAKTYYVVEEALEGYITKYGSGTDSMLAERANDENPYIYNRETTGGYELPSTGGSGTGLFKGLGMLLAFGAGAILLMRRCRRAR